MMRMLGFTMTSTSGGGSERSFSRPGINTKFRTHEPHPEPDMKRRAVKKAHKYLVEHGVIW